MKKIALVLIGIMALGCSTNSESKNPFENLTYYKFTNDDNSNLLLNFNLDNSIIYKNQDGETIVFEVKDYLKNKSTYSKGSFLSNSSIEYYRFDQQQLILSLVDLPYLSNQIEVKHERHPLNFNPNIYPHKKKASSFNSYIEFPFWNGYLGDDEYDITIILDYNIQVTSMSFNNTTYNNVRIIESGNTETINPQLDYPRNVHILYYDTEYGVIGFNDLEGNHWRLD
ncbi:hypothetical protein [Psychroserpens ponticola]|uniref:Lipoprotein n=1 Tax=Psychroserpens ponticola TaxID=2932268 RepID=A0ABY7RZJ1_9FLAO|nr:hypothetical protein [Psychroserpens ponticola]WCO01110.1 hypothetical protein MUN68_013680 [Psychroserpens ponticola]